VGYNVTLTVKDNSGAATTASLAVTVNNVAPAIALLKGDTNINEGAIAHFSATATDPGFDNLTYTWNFGDGSDPVTGQQVNHIFARSGNYTVTLTRPLAKVFFGYCAR
jgi:PKD repeat protein